MTIRCRYNPPYNHIKRLYFILRNKLVIMHLGTANTMALSGTTGGYQRSKKRSKVKKIINKCNTCKVYRAKPYGPSTTAAMPTFRTERGKPFQTNCSRFRRPFELQDREEETG